MVFLIGTWQKSATRIYDFFEWLLKKYKCFLFDKHRLETKWKSCSFCSSFIRRCGPSNNGLGWVQKSFTEILPLQDSYMVLLQLLSFMFLVGKASLVCLGGLIGQYCTKFLRKHSDLSQNILFDWAKSQEHWWTICYNSTPANYPGSTWARLQSDHFLRLDLGMEWHRL